MPGDLRPPVRKHMTWVQRFVIIAVASGMCILLALIIPIYGKRADAHESGRPESEPVTGM